MTPARKAVLQMALAAVISALVTVLLAVGPALWKIREEHLAIQEQQQRILDVLCEDHPKVRACMAPDGAP